MTTITTEAIPTTTTTGADGASRRLTSRTWRYVATFAAGAALSVAVAAGISAATDSPSTHANTPATAASSTSSSSANDQCPMFAGKPC